MALVDSYDMLLSCTMYLTCFSFIISIFMHLKNSSFCNNSLCCAIEKLDELFTSAGYRITGSEYIYRKTVNRKEGINVQRVFIQGKYVKPSCAVSDV